MRLILNLTKMFINIFFDPKDRTGSDVFQML